MVYFRLIASHLSLQNPVFTPTSGMQQKKSFFPPPFCHDPGDLDISLYIEVKRHIVIVKIPAVKGNG